MALGHDELTKELKGGRIRAAYLLAGEEPLLRDDALAAIRGAVLAGGVEDFNLDRLSGRSTTPGQLRDALRALPIMCDRRLVILTEPEGRRGGSRVVVDALLEAMDELLAQSETVLAVVTEKVDKRARWVKAFKEPAALVDCDPPKPGRSVVAFIKRESKRQGVVLEDGAPELLAERVGPQLLLLRQEIAKAALLAGPGEPVTRAHVEAGSSQLAEQPIWDLTDAIGEGKTAEALMILSRLLAGGAAAPAMLGVLAGHFRKLARVRGGGRVAGPPFVVRKLEQQARRYSVERIRMALTAIHDTDIALKGAGALPPNLAIERLVLHLAM